MLKYVEKVVCAKKVLIENIFKISSDCLTQTWKEHTLFHSLEWPSSIGPDLTFLSFSLAKKEAIKWHDVKYILKYKNGTFRLASDNILKWGKCAPMTIWEKPIICQRPYPRKSFFSTTSAQV